MQEPHQTINERSHNVIFSQENVKFIVYQGLSMGSTFQDMDVLYYVHSKKIRPGDIVVIKVSEHEHKIIHRVISAGEKGIRTIGDNNPHLDSWILRPDQVMGSVVYCYRGSQRFRVRGGIAGLTQMLQVRLKHFTIKAAYPVLSTICHNFPVSSLMRVLIQPRQIAFKRPDGTELHLLVRGRVIGRRLPGHKWQIKPPFKFFLDESNLPD